MKNWADCPILTREDGSYVITMNGMPYHVPNNEEFGAFHKQITDYKRDHPEQFSPEPVYAPSDEELLTQAKQRKTNEIQREIMKSKLDLIEPLVDYVMYNEYGAAQVMASTIGMSTPDEAISETKSAILARIDSRFTTLTDRYALLDKVNKATTVEEVSAIVVE